MVKMTSVLEPMHDEIWIGIMDEILTRAPQFSDAYEVLRAAVTQYRKIAAVGGRPLKCEVCGGKNGLQRHHKFSQTEWARKLYEDLIDDPRNVQIVCSRCHASHASPKLTNWNEVRFCEALGISPRSKLARASVLVDGGRNE